jgi:Rrf2 family nitric oxide-sensitive transcriptional repressor
MRLTTFSDYSLRVLMYLGTQEHRLATIDEIAGAHGISANHLMKVVHHLAQQRYIETVRGKNGGMRLARPPQSIRVGEVLRTTEEGFALVECFEDPVSHECRIERTCVLKHALAKALQSFLDTLDRYTLADLIPPARPLVHTLSVSDITGRGMRRSATAGKQPRR